MRIQILILGFKGLSNKTATATATAAAAKKTSLKKRSRAASLIYRAYSNSFNSSNVGKFLWS